MTVKEGRTARNPCGSEFMVHVNQMEAVKERQDVQSCNQAQCAVTTRQAKCIKIPQKGLGHTLRPKLRPVRSGERILHIPLKLVAPPSAFRTTSNLRKKSNTERSLTRKIRGVCVHPIKVRGPLDKHHLVLSKPRKPALQHLAHVGWVVTEVYRILAWWGVIKNQPHQWRNVKRTAYQPECRRG